jgi:hypothetical protein
MLKLVSKFVLEVLPPACAVVIAGVLLFGHHQILFGGASPDAEVVAADGPIFSPPVTQRIEDEHASLAARDSESVSKPAESKADAKPLPQQGASKRTRSVGSIAPAPPASAVPIPLPSPLVAAANAPPPPSPTAPANLVASADPASKPETEPTRVLGVPIPAPIAAIGSKLNPAPMLRAGEMVIDKIVVAAKSVVPDFSK